MPFHRAAIIRAITPLKIISTIRFESSYDFLLVVITNLLPVLHVYRFQDIAFDGPKIGIFGYPSLLLTPPPGRRSSPRTISVKFPVDVNGWPK